MTAWFSDPEKRDAAMAAALTRGAGVKRRDESPAHLKLPFALNTSEHAPARGLA